MHYKEIKRVIKYGNFVIKFQLHNLRDLGHSHPLLHPWLHHLEMWMMEAYFLVRIK